MPILNYAFCDDWFIYAKDENGNLYSVNTELWDEWLNFPKGSDEEENAIEKYMLPIAYKKWNLLHWFKIPKEWY